MSPERANSTINLPRRLRIHQKLGMLTSNKVIKENLFPRIERLERLEMSPEELVDDLADTFTTFAENPDHGIGGLAYGYVPKVLDVLVKDEEQKAHTIELWNEFVSEQKQAQTWQTILQEAVARHQPTTR